jgi:hypothetical protein
MPKDKAWPEVLLPNINRGLLLKHCSKELQNVMHKSSQASQNFPENLFRILPPIQISNFLNIKTLQV